LGIQSAGAVVGEFRGPVFRLHTKILQQFLYAIFYGKLIDVNGETGVEGDFRTAPFLRLLPAFFGFPS